MSDRKISKTPKYYNDNRDDITWDKDDDNDNSKSNNSNDNKNNNLDGSSNRVTNIVIKIKE